MHLGDFEVKNVDFKIRSQLFSLRKMVQLPLTPIELGPVSPAGDLAHLLQYLPLQTAPSLCPFSLPLLSLEGRSPHPHNHPASNKYPDGPSACTAQCSPTYLANHLLPGQVRARVPVR